MATRSELMQAAAEAFIKEMEAQGAAPDLWDNLGDGESLYWTGPDGFEALSVNIAVMVDAIVDKLGVKFTPE